MTASQINQYIIDFLQTNAGDMAENLIQVWNNKNNQKEFNKIIKKTVKKPKKTKDPLKPKQAKSAYMFFCSEERKNITDMKAKEVLVELGKRWKEFKADKNNQEELDRYNELSANDKIRFQKEMKTYNPQKPTSESESEKSDGEKPKVKKSKNNKPKKINGYNVFCTDNINSVKENNNNQLSRGDLMKELGKLWKALDEEQKQEYKNIAASRMAAQIE